MKSISEFLCSFLIKAAFWIIVYKNVISEYDFKWKTQVHTETFHVCKLENLHTYKKQMFE